MNMLVLRVTMNVAISITFNQPEVRLNGNDNVGV